MSDDVARAVGAGDGNSNPIVIAGKQVELKPLSIRELAEIERECLRTYKAEYLSTFQENAHLLPGETGMDILVKEMRVAAKWDIEDLPLKWAHDATKIKITKALREWLIEYGGLNVALVEAKDKKIREFMIQRTGALCLDNGLLSEEKYEELTAMKVHRTQVGYVNWWITGCFNGMMAMCHQTVSRSGITKEELLTALSDDPSLMNRMSRELENLTAPAVGNG